MQVQLAGRQPNRSSPSTWRPAGHKNGSQAEPAPHSFARALARAKAREAPVRLRSSVVAVLVARWSPGSGPTRCAHRGHAGAAERRVLPVCWGRRHAGAPDPRCHSRPWQRLPTLSRHLAPVIPLLLPLPTTVRGLLPAPRLQGIVCPALCAKARPQLLKAACSSPSSTRSG